MAEPIAPRPDAGPPKKAEPADAPSSVEPVGSSAAPDEAAPDEAAPDEPPPVVVDAPSDEPTAVIGATLQQPTVVIEVPPEPPRRRRFGWIIAIAVVAVVLVVGVILADGWARSWATGYVREQVVDVLDLPPGTPVDVELSGGSMLWQAIRGSIDEVRVDIDRFELGGLAGSADFVARGVPIDSSKPVESLDIEVRVPESEVRKLAEYFSGLELTTIELRDEHIRVGSELQLLFLTVPFAIDLLPSGIGHGVSFDPQVIMVGQEKFTVADLRASPVFSSIAGTLLASRDFCVADRLPAALSVDEVVVAGKELVVSLSADGVALGGPSFTSKGTCPAV